MAGFGTALRSRERVKTTLPGHAERGVRYPDDLTSWACHSCAGLEKQTQRGRVLALIWDVDVDGERWTARGEPRIRVKTTAVDKATVHVPLDKWWKVGSRCQNVNSLRGIQWRECPCSAVLKLGSDTTMQWLIWG
jgi:hypothetical protein